MKTVNIISASLLIAAVAPAHATAPTIAEQGRVAIERIQAETRDALRANAAPASVGDYKVVPRAGVEPATFPLGV